MRSRSLWQARSAAYVGPVLAACLLLGLWAFALHDHDEVDVGQHCRLCDTGAVVPAPVPADGDELAETSDGAPRLSAEPAPLAYDSALASDRRAPPALKHRSDHTV